MCLHACNELKQLYSNFKRCWFDISPFLKFLTIESDFSFDGCIASKLWQPKSLHDHLYQAWITIQQYEGVLQTKDLWKEQESSNITVQDYLRIGKYVKQSHHRKIIQDTIVSCIKSSGNSKRTNNQSLYFPNTSKTKIVSSFQTSQEAKLKRFLVISIPNSILTKHERKG